MDIALSSCYIARVFSSFLTLNVILLLHVYIKVNGTVAGAEAEATAAVKAGTFSSDASNSAMYRLARGARVAVVSAESGGGASLLTYLLGQVRGKKKRL